MEQPRKRQPANIADVARLAGVSKTTVSHALNGNGRVGAETRERVLAVAERLGYRPNRAARGLRSERYETLVLVLPGYEVHVSAGQQTLASDHYMQLLRAAALTAFQRGYRLLVAPPVTSRGQVNELGVDGAIICDPVARDPQIDYFAEAGVPVVTHERVAGRPDHIWHVNADNVASILSLLDHLVDRGAEAVALLISSVATTAVEEQRDAYLRWCEHRHQAPILVEVADLTDEASAIGRVRGAFEGHRGFDALVDMLAPIGLRACQERGLSIPEDVLIASLMDTVQTRGSDPPITAVDFNPLAVGEAATNLLVDLIEGHHVSAPVIIPTSLKVRRSTTRRPRST